MKQWVFEAYLLTKKPVLDSCWLDHWKWIMPDLMRVVPEFLSNEEGLNRFSRHVLPKLSKINDLSKVSKKDRIEWISTYPKLVKYISTLNCSKSAKCLVWKFMYLHSSHGDARNIKFGHLINIIERVPLGTLPQAVVMSLAHNHLTNLFISSYREAAVIKFK